MHEAHGRATTRTLIGGRMAHTPACASPLKDQAHAGRRTMRPRRGWVRIGTSRARWADARSRSRHTHATAPGRSQCRRVRRHAETGRAPEAPSTCTRGRPSVCTRMAGRIRCECEGAPAKRETALGADAYGPVRARPGTLDMHLGILWHPGRTGRSPRVPITGQKAPFMRLRVP